MTVTRRGLFVLGGALAVALSPRGSEAASGGESAASFSFETIDGQLPLKGFNGKVLLIVNTASKCGFAPQLSSLETLWGRYRERGLVVLGVPSGDFGGQELANSKAIKTFCAMEFGVTFPLTVKTSVVGQNAHPFYKWAARERPGSQPQWNFHKYLIGRDGHVAAVFPTAVDPLEDRVVAAIEAALGASAIGG